MTPYYADEAVTLYHADALALQPSLRVVDHVITDPPYGDQTHANARSNRDRGTTDTTIDFRSTSVDALRAFFAALQVRRWLIATMEWRHVVALEAAPPAGWEFVRFGVWVKTNPMPQITGDRPAQGWEGIAYLHRADGAVRKRWHGGGEHGNWIGPLAQTRLHPTAKPEALLMSWVQRFTDPGEIILDPFAGSGTTGVAAKRLGRRAVLIERDELYCEVAARRLEQGTLLATVAAPVQSSLMEATDGVV